MSARASLPGADELFRQTGPLEPKPVDAESLDRTFPVMAPESAATVALPAREVGTDPGAHRSVRRGPGDRAPSGRQRHEEKITVYVSGGELVDLERARLHLRAEHGLAVDRGRIVREALAVVLADLESKGGDSILVRRLRGR